MAWASYHSSLSRASNQVQSAQTLSCIPSMPSLLTPPPAKIISGPMLRHNGAMSPRAFSPRATTQPVSPDAATRRTMMSPDATTRALPKPMAPPYAKAGTIASSVSFPLAGASSPRQPMVAARVLPKQISPQLPGATTSANTVSFPASASSLSRTSQLRAASPVSNMTLSSQRSVRFAPATPTPRIAKPVIKEAAGCTTPKARIQPALESRVSQSSQNLLAMGSVVSERVVPISELVADGRLTEESAKPAVVGPLANISVSTAESIAEYVEKVETIAEEPVAENIQSTEARGSAGMGLPCEMSEQTVATIKATAAVVAPKALDITQHFYSKVLTKMPELFSLFNKANQGGGVQPQALAAAIVAYASNIDNLGPLVVPKGPVDGICNKHCGLNILPAHYVVVHANLMETIGEVLGDAVTPDIAAGWSEAVLFLAKVMIDWEERLYSEAEARAGGWRGMKDVTVSDIEEVTPDVKRFTFKDPAYDGPYDFIPGQFLTVKIDPNGDGLTAPRHYTVTSFPGDPYLQCSVKRVPGGVVSNFLHDSVKVGETVKLAAPYGIFTPGKDDRTAVLISAGIGVTPVLNFCHHFGASVELLVHVDKSAASHPYLDYFNSLSCKKMFHYTSDGRPVASDLANAIVNEVGTSHSFYLCGPPSFMREMVSSLKGLGASSVHFEAFGPQLGCPIAH